MFLSKLKVVVSVVAAVAVIGMGTGFLMSRAPAPVRQQASNSAQQTADPGAPPAARSGDDGKTSVEVPAEEEGKLLLVGTDVDLGETPGSGDLVEVRFPFLVIQVEGKDPNQPVSDANPVNPAKLPPESQWIYVADAPESHFKEAVSEARAGNLWDQYKKSNTPVYRRWQEGDPLPAGRIQLAFEKRNCRNLKPGDRVKKDQLLALVDPTAQASEVSRKIAKLDSAEAEFREAIKTKEEAIRRASQAEFTWSKGQGLISKDDYEAALLNRDRYTEEQNVKDAARRVAAEELTAANSMLKMCEIRSSDPGVVKEILKHRGEAIRRLEPVVRLEVQGAADAPADKPAPTPPAQPVAPALSVSSQVSGVVLVVGTEIKDGEKVPADQVVTVKDVGRKFRRLRVGDAVEEGQLLAVLDDRLARADLDQQKAKVQVAEAGLALAAKVKAAAADRMQSLSRLGAAVSAQDLDAAKLEVDRAAADEQIKTAEVRQAQAGLKTSEIMLEMYEIRSPVSGVIRAISKGRGETVRSLDTIVQIEETGKP